MKASPFVHSRTCINRIRLEFKGKSTVILSRPEKPVLIESDWNLKPSKTAPFLTTPRSINRIRLEFKVFPVVKNPFTYFRINRIRLEFKVIIKYFLLKYGLMY